GAAASGAGGDLGQKAANAKRLQDLLGDADFFAAIAVRSRSEGDANGVADAFLQQDTERGGRGDDAFRAHSGFGQSEVQRVVAAGGPAAIDVDHVLSSADLGAEDDLVAPQAVLLSTMGGVEG